MAKITDLDLIEDDTKILSEETKKINDFRKELHKRLFSESILLKDIVRILFDMITGESPFLSFFQMQRVTDSHVKFEVRNLDWTFSDFFEIQYEEPIYFQI